MAQDSIAEEDDQVYNIIPLHDVLADHDALLILEVRAAVSGLKLWAALPIFNESEIEGWTYHPGMDMLDWLGAFFGFQADNVKNQREHIVLLLANFQMRLQPPPNPIDKLKPSVVHQLRRELLKNYEKWCSFLNLNSNLWFLIRDPDDEEDHHQELIYCCLYLLIWGEAANLRFMPECLCYIFHQMARELNTVIQGDVCYRPVYCQRNGFLTEIVKPIYEAAKAEAEISKNGRAPHSVWRNYDDMNEYFWSKRCLQALDWPPNKNSNYLAKPGNPNKVGKTGFVEQRSFLNIYRSFDHLWTGLILMLQAMMILAFNGDGLPWNVLYDRDVQGSLLTIFITWSGLRLLQATLDMIMQHKLISRDTKLVGIRMVMKIVIASIWTVIFSYLLARVWIQRTHDRRWSTKADMMLFQFLETSAVFIFPEMLAILLFIFPWIRNFVERKEWRIFYFFTWWFQSRLFVARGLRESVFDNMRYSLFWLFVLSAKFCFSYFLQVRPLVEPTRELLRLNMVHYDWHEFFSNHNRFVVLVVWAPVVLVYMMDLQIWYSVCSSILGAMLGLWAHIGEIRNMQQLKLRFPFFASAITFNLAPEEALLGKLNHRAHFQWIAVLKDMARRVKLRYGLGKDYTKFESNTLEARKFAYLWNKIIRFFREEDLISNSEVELLEIPAPFGNSNVVQWPAVLLSNEVLIALAIAVDWHGMDDNRLWARICKNEYRRCAVVECYYSVKHLILECVLKRRSREYRIMSLVFEKIERDISECTFCQTYNVNHMGEVHARVHALVNNLLEGDNPEKEIDVKSVVSACQNLYEVLTRDFSVPLGSYLKDKKLANNELLFLRAIDVKTDAAFFRQLRRLRTILSTEEAMDNVPKNLEARRRIAFFSNSIFMNMPHAPRVEKMLSFSVLTPYYSEDVIYSFEKLLKPNDDGVTILFYLQSIYRDEWNNLLERTGLQENKTARNILERKDIRRDLEYLKANLPKETLDALRLWASHRGQTLGRTVRGMMYYHHALETLAYLDSASEQMMRPNTGLARQRSSATALSSQEKATALLKFTYVVACQIYGTQKLKKSPHAEDILYLMRQHPVMRVAYVDEVDTPEGIKFYSVLVKYDQKLNTEVEIYRIELPGNLKMGEGKPENQNHALIFTRGDAVQAIDMNQDNYFEETLKVRNLLQEFTKHSGLKKPQLLGVREHVFTGSVSSLAWFMSCQESSFVTLGQRVLAFPLKIRMHYGHPDMFDRIWFLTRGGISKASRTINISEDIFAGFNCTLRGGNVTHNEYIQVGKGRDVGLNQIAIFEGKVSGGNAEQILSRDVYRLGHHLDFFRMLSFYYTTVGFFISNMITVISVYVFLWGRVYLALSGIEDVIAKTLSNTALAASLNQQFLVQLGLLTALPMVVENSLERGFTTALWDFLTMQLELCSVFFTFSLGTKSHYFGRTLLHGGARYRATGRDFVVKRERFAENYRLFSRSHFVKGVELIVLLLIYESYGRLAKNTTVYIFLTLSSWFLALSWIMAPFLFNPSGFNWLQTVYDFEDFQNWLWYKPALRLEKATSSWEVWWEEQNDHLRTTGFWGKTMEVILSLRFFLIQYGLVYRLQIAANNKSIYVYLLSWLYVVVALLLYMALARASARYSAKKHLYYRSVQMLVALFILLIIVALVQFTSFELTDIFYSFLAFIPTGWGLISISLVMKPYLESTNLWSVVVAVARLYEFAIAIVVMTPLVILSWLPGFQEMQNRVLFNQAFSRGLEIMRVFTKEKRRYKS